MTNFTKFLAIGAIALGFANSANANSVDHNQKEDIKAQVSKTISQSIKKQFDMGFLKEKAQVNVNIMTDIETAIAMDKEDGIALEHSNLSATKSTATNNLSRINNECVVNLVYNEKGEVPSLTSSHVIKDITKFQNENQKIIAQKFVALHEHHHCEFINIDQPIIAFGKDSKFNEEVNFSLKGQSEIGGKTTYQQMLNENYADVSAAISLMKEYGTNNPDLKFVLKALSTQRHASYLVHTTDSHSTHFSLESMLSQDTINKVNSINDSKSFEKLALEISNKGVQKIFAEQPELTKMLSSEESIVFSIQAKIAGEVFRQSLSEAEFKTFPLNNYGPNVKKGLVESIVDKVTSPYDFSLLKEERAKNNGEIDAHVYAAFTKKIYESIEQEMGAKDYKELQSKITYSAEQLKIFATTFPKIENNNSLNTSIQVNKGGMLGKMAQLRKEFVESTKDNSNKLGM